MKIILYSKGSRTCYENITKILICDDYIKLKVNEEFDIMDIKTIENSEIESISVFKS